jgi:very-short-patch-repair endonuclease
MNEIETTNYPDISDILARKERARRARARMSFVEKILWCGQMRERLAPFTRAREQGLALQAARRSRARTGSD